MKRSFLPLTIVLATALANAQVPAPDFCIQVSYLTLSSLSVGFQVQGPPSSPYQILVTAENPYLGPPTQIFPLTGGNLPLAGSASFQLPIPSFQGLEPDVWVGCVLFVNGNPVLAGLTSIGFFFPALPIVGLPDLAATVEYERTSGDIDAHIQVAGCPGEQITAWWTTTCPTTLGEQPPLGPYNWIGSGNLDAGGAASFQLNQQNIPIGACIVLTKNVNGIPTVIASRHV